jgi:hypothetical protein
MVRTHRSTATVQWFACPSWSASARTLQAQSEPLPESDRASQVWSKPPGGTGVVPATPSRHRVSRSCLGRWPS